MNSLRKFSRTRPTMHDVAKLAGVSKTTVSFVINRVAQASIPDDTRDRVLEAVKTLGYRPNATARGLRKNRSNIIGFLTDEIASTPFAGNIIAGAQDAAWASGRILMIVNTGGNREIKAAGVETLLDRQVDGMIYAAMYHRTVDPPASMFEAPAVLLDCFTADRSLPSVVPDEAGGGRDATLALLRKGHRRIGFINLRPPHMMPAAAGRLDGYKQALAAFGVRFDDALVRSGDTRSSADSGYKYTLELMRQPDPPTALFCTTDRMAMGAYDALRELGLSIPGDIAVIGFDNQEVIAAYLRPPLTTMALPHYEMGQWAVNYLIAHADQPESMPPIQETITCRFVERASI